MVDNDSLDNMIKTIVSEYHFSPSEISKMYVDNLDFQGIQFWYDECVRLNELRKPK